MIKMNGTAAFIVRQLSEGADEQMLVSKVLEKYDATEEAAKESVLNVISNLRRAGLIEDE